MAVKSYTTTNRFKAQLSKTTSTADPDASNQNARGTSFSDIQRQINLGAAAGIGGSTNPPFAIAPLSNPNATDNNLGDQRMVRGYIRRADGEDTRDPTSKYRLNFMFNPEMVQRQYVAYLDQQSLDPFNTLDSGNLTAPPGILDFSFDLFFDRQLEVARDLKHPGVRVDYDFFDLVVRGVVPQSAMSGSAIADNGIMLVNPRNITVVFSPKLQVMGKAYNASISFQKFSNTMTMTRMTISLQMKVFSFGAKPLTYTYGTTSAVATYRTTVPYDTQVTADPGRVFFDKYDMNIWFPGGDGGAGGGSGGGTGAGTTGNIFVVGDSLTEGSHTHLTADLPGRHVTIDYRHGRPTTEGISILRGKGSGLEPVVLVSLGTNDSGNGGEFSGKIDQIMSICGSGRKVFIDTIWRPGFEAMNTALIAAKGKYANLTVIDVAAVINAHAEVFLPHNPSLGADHVHLNDAGYALMAQANADVLKTATPNVSGGSNTKIAFQVAKSRGASDRVIIALFETGFAESGWKNYANTNVPSSMSIPHDAVGHDHTSVGIMQQQVSSDGSGRGFGWGTVQQCMNPAYACGSFLNQAIPKDAHFSGAPHQLAQAVQRSATSSGSNYQKFESQARSLLASGG